MTARLQFLAFKLIFRYLSMIVLLLLGEKVTNPEQSSIGKATQDWLVEAEAYTKAVTGIEREE